MVSGVMEAGAAEQCKQDPPSFGIGNTVKVYFKIREGDKDRVQVFAGIVIARKGSGPSATFTVRRISHGVGVERVFPLHSPRVERVEVVSVGHVRRAKLYYLRQRTGKQTRLRQKTTKKPVK
jgi:large subunit ribosomal protein L19